jgi:hypothetical protein
LRLDLPPPVRRRLNLRLASQVPLSGCASDRLPALIGTQLPGCPSIHAPAFAAARFSGCPGWFPPQACAQGFHPPGVPAASFRLAPYFPAPRGTRWLRFPACAGPRSLRVRRRCILWLAPSFASSGLPAIRLRLSPELDPSAHRCLQPSACAETCFFQCASDVPFGLRRRLHLLAPPAVSFQLSSSAALWLSGDTASRLSSEPVSSGCAVQLTPDFQRGIVCRSIEV